MPRMILAKTAGFTLIELMTVVVVITSLAALAVPTFVTYRDRSRVAQAVGSSEAIRSALASYAAGHSQQLYPATGEITDFNSLRLVVNANGGMLPPSAIFSVTPEREAILPALSSDISQHRFLSVHRCCGTVQ